MSRQIDALYELAFKEKAYAATVELQWFLTEQVEEEKSAREIVAKFRLVGRRPASLFDSIASSARTHAGERDSAAAARHTTDAGGTCAMARFRAVLMATVA